MADPVKYMGVGANLEEARDNLAENAAAAGYTGKPRAFEYTVKLTVGKRTFTGQADSDYGNAFAAVLEEAQMKSSEVPNGALEISVTGLYAAQQAQSAARGAGAAPNGPTSKTITDLF